MTTIDQKDLSFLKVCGRWPHWPFCPVKRYTKDAGVPECGIVRDVEPIGGNLNGKCEPIVRILYIFGGWTKEQWNAAKKYEYESVEAMLADGWIVD